MSQIEQDVEEALKSSASMVYLMASAKPEAIELLKQAFRVGFADGVLWQACKVADIYSRGSKIDGVLRDLEVE